MDKAGMEEEILNSPLGMAYEAVSQFSGASWAQRLIMTCWAGHTYVYRTFPVTPRLSFCADGPGTGKSVNMEVTLSLSNKPKKVGYASQAAVYSYLSAYPDTTFGLDEIDKAFGQDGRKTSRAILASVVNEGYMFDGSVVVNRGTKPVEMEVFAPIAMAGMGVLPEDTLTRCVVIKLVKATPEAVWLPERHKPTLRRIGDDMGKWLTSRESAAQLETWRERIADIGTDPRFRSIITPLLAISELAGIGNIFRIAVDEILTGISEFPIASMSDLMILDMSDSWGSDDKILTFGEIHDMLVGHPSHRWDWLTNDRIGERTVAGYMRQHGVTSQLRTRDGKKVRGYVRADVLRNSDKKGQAA